MQRGALDRLPVVLGVATVWWCLVAVVSAANQVGLDGAAWRHALLSSLVACAPWVPLTIGIFHLSRLVPLRKRRFARALAIHLAAACGVVVARAAFIHGLDPWLNWYPETPRFTQVLLHSVQHNLFQYWLLVGVAHAAIYAREAIERARVGAQLEAALGRAELSALAATLQPHFLFNTLQSVAEMVHRDAHAADRMLVSLSAMLRRLLDDRRPVVPLRDELAFARDYLAIEKVRFGDLLEVRWEVSPEVEHAPVPRLSIQPLIENALRHGLWPSGRRGTLVVTAHRRGDDLVVAVSDDGLGLDPAPEPRGTGLATVRARLDRLYPGRGHVSLESRPGGGAEARVVIPCEATCAS
ncbi:MAG TPA: histidine kinase [Kofleriaceae bacterium]|nr:histidine kinase [Kofleriaceae bacterium]